MSRAGRRIVAVAAVLLSGCATAGRDEAEPARRIRHSEARLQESPRHYPAVVELGAAHLDLARRTLDPAHLAAAREAAERSLAIQPNLEAFRLGAAAAAAGHRFEEALRWADLAASAAPEGEDAGVTALRVEALLGLGRGHEARALLPEEGFGEHFHHAAAIGQWWVETGDPERSEREAAAAFVAAADLARQAGVPELEAWAWVRAAGVHLDAGNPDLAAPYLARAAALTPRDFELAIHRAELAEATGSPDKALRDYLRLLRRRDDPELRRRAFVLLRAEGRGDDAQEHFEAAERTYRRALDAGEVYTLEGLARLYCDGGTRMEEARRLAQENLRYKGDRGAREALACTTAAAVTR